MKREADMNDAHFDELLALRLKRPLTPDEQAQLESWLATQPSARARWAEQAALGDALHRLPSPPVSSNFQTRVWEEIDAAESGSRTSVTSPTSLARGRASGSCSPAPPPTAAGAR